jgi:hypothetical protein
MVLRRNNNIKETVFISGVILGLVLMNNSQYVKMSGKIAAFSK